jgi:hypothetical protein
MWMTPRTSSKRKILVLTTIQTTFLSKSTLNFVGFVLKAAILCTLTQGPIRQESATAAEEGSLKRLGLALLTYLILVLIVVGSRQVINRQTQSLTMSKDRQDTLKAFLAGLNLIPAWGFKDFVAVMIAGTAWWAAIVVLLVATVAAVLLEPPPPPDGEVPTTADNIRKTMAGCMALGVGFAMHTIPVTLWRNMGYKFFTIPVCSCYALGVTALVVFVQVSIKKIKRDPDQLYYNSFLNFSSASGNFMSAWAWDSLLEAFRRLLVTIGKDSCLITFWINLGWAFLVLIIAALAVVALQLQSEEGDHSLSSGEMDAGLASLSKTIAACCVAWAFMDVFQGVYKCISFHGYHVLGAWVFALVILVIAVAIMHYGTKLIERGKASAQIEGSS